MQSDDKIKDLFASKLVGFESQPPAGMWNKINGNLSAGVEKIPVRKMALRRTIYIASGIAAMLIVTFLLLPDAPAPVDNNLADKPAMNNNKSTTNQQVYIPKSTDAQTSLSQQLLYANIDIQLSRTKTIVVPQTITNQPKDTTSNSLQTTVSEKPQEDKPADNRLDDKELKKKIEEFEKAGQGQNDYLLADASYLAGKQNKKLAVSVSGSSGLSELSDKKVPVPTRLLRQALATNAETNYASFVEEKLTWANSPRVKIKHRQPVSFGLKIGKQLSNDLSVETGLVYTYLSSQLSPANHAYKVEGDMKFHYLGIPLSLNYTFARLGKAEFHFSAGGMIQKDVLGKIVGSQEFKNWLSGETDQSLIENYISDKISQDNPQLSIMGNVGVSYPLYKMLNVYASVGGAYYFDAKNEFRTVYSDKQLQPDLNVGLRMDFY
jgi:hypothetical protein